jgi:hypothetical protein
MAPRDIYWIHLYFVADVATNMVATLSVGFPTSCPTAFRGSSSLNVLHFGGIATIGIPTLGAGLSKSLHTAFRRFFWLHWRFGVVVATLAVGFPTWHMSSPGSSTPNMSSFCGVAALGVGFPASCLMASVFFSEMEFCVVACSASVFWRRVGSHHLFSTLNMVINIGVATLFVGFPSSCRVASRGLSCLVWCCESASGRAASRRSASVCQRPVLWLPKLMFTADVILSRRR